MKRILIYSLIIPIFFITSCKDNLGLFGKKKGKALTENQFLYMVMDKYYYWRSDMPIELSNDLSPDSYFQKLLSPLDHWSYITKVKDLEKQEYLKLGTNQESMDKTFNKKPFTFEFIKQSTKFHDRSLKIDDYTNRIHIRKLQYEMNGKKAVNKYKVIHNKGKKIGYLSYSKFELDQENEVLNVFTQFKASKVEELILDFRYNPGGAVSTAVKMAGIIAPKKLHNKVFMYKEWNDKMTAQYKNEGLLEMRTVEYLNTEVENNLDLKRVYILTSQNTASASELIINGLKPYMNVICIGNRTHGKYVGSITITDGDNKQAWAVQPIVFKSLNVDGETDYINGLKPTIEIMDDYKYNLGDERESLLNTAIQHIGGRRNFPSRKINNIAKSSQPLMFPESYYMMYDGKIILNSLD